MSIRLALAAAFAVTLYALPEPARAQTPAAPTAATATPAWTAPKRRRIILMRHGDVSYFDAAGKPVPDPDKVVLTDKGKAQADASGAYLKTIGVTKVDRVVSSDLTRTIETAERALTAAGFAGKPTEIGALREMRNGPSKDVATADLPRELLLLSQHRVPGDARFIGRESVDDLRARIDPAIDALLNDKTWDTALLVLHALVNNAILSRALAGDAAYFGRFDHGAGCFSIIDVGRDMKDAIVKAVNVCPDPSPYAGRLHTLESLTSQAMRGRQ